METPHTAADFAAERERIEEKHRLEVLNLLRSFEFERKEAEKKQKSEQNESNNTGKFLQCLTNIEKELGDDNDDLRFRFEQEKQAFLERMKKITEEAPDGDEESKDETVAGNHGYNDGTTDHSGHIGQNGKRDQKVDHSVSSTEKLTSTDSPKVIKDLPLEKDQSIKDPTHSDSSELVSEIEFDEGDRSEGEIVLAKNLISKNLYDNTNGHDLSSSMATLKTENEKLGIQLEDQRDIIGRLKDDVSKLNKKVDDIRTIVYDQQIIAELKENEIRKIIDEDQTESPERTTDKQQRKTVGNTTSTPRNNRSNSVLTFQIEELNVENEELKAKVEELGRKIQSTVEEYELRKDVLKEKIDGIIQKLTSEENITTKDCINELKEISLKDTPGELLDTYTTIVLSGYSTSKSPDLCDLGLRQEIQSLENLFDIEVFKGHEFEMKDEMKQVLRDKERELIVAYAVEKLRSEIRHRHETQCTLEELCKEREKDLELHQAVNKIVKEHLGVTEDNEVKKALVDGLVEKEVKVGLDSMGVDVLKAEKAELEENLRELQQSFDTERQQWLEKIQNASQDGRVNEEDKEKVIESLRAQNVIMEQVLITERFYLSRLYYFEMKEELEQALKQNQFERSGKYEKERVVQAWKHHAEIGDLYRKILEKEAEGLEGMRGEDQQDDSGISEDNITKKVQLKHDMLELQRCRCREYETATLILERAVNAVETAVQEDDNRLTSGNYLQRQSSWTLSSDDEELGTMSSKEMDSNKEKGIGDSEIASEGDNTKEVLRKALKKILQRLLREQNAHQEHEADESTSDSDFSEESVGKLGDSKYDKGEAEETNIDPEGTSLDDKTEQGNLERTTDVVSGGTTKNGREKATGPEVLRAPEDIERLLTLERFNMSRLLRDEYVDKIRSKRNKIRRLKDQVSENNEELLAKFQEQVAAVLDKIDFTGRKEAPPTERNRLLSMPSDDSGIAEFAEADKDNVVLEYKKLLEKARQDLNRAQKTFQRKRPSTRNPKEIDSINSDLDEMKADLKERQNDLDELEEKRDEFDQQQRSLSDNIQKTSAHEYGTENVGTPSDGGTAEVQRNKTPEDNPDPVVVVPNNERLGETEERRLQADKDTLDSEENTKDEGKIETDPATTKTTDIKDAGTGAQQQNSEEEKKRELDVSEKESQTRERELRDENRRKQQEINDLQKKLVEGTGGEEILEDLQRKLEELTTEKHNLENKCAKLEKEADRGLARNEALEKLENENAVLEKEIEERQDKIEDLQRKIVSGTGGEVMLKDLQEELKEMADKNKELTEENRLLMDNKVDNLEPQENLVDINSLKGEDENLLKEIDDLAKQEEKLQEDLAGELKKRVGELIKKNEDLSEQVQKLQNDLVSGTGNEDLLNDLRVEIENLNKENKDLRKKLENMDDRETLEELKSKNREISKHLTNAQRDFVKDTDNEKQVKELQDKLEDSILRNKDLKKQLGNEENSKPLKTQIEKLTSENEMMSKQVEKMNQNSMNGDEIVRELQKHLGDLDSENEVLEKLLENNNTVIARGQLEELAAENEKLKEENKQNKEEINELQRKLVEGTGAEEVMEVLQRKLNELKDVNDKLEKRCRDFEKLENESARVHGDEDPDEESKRLANDSKIKGEEIQRSLVEATDGEEFRGKHQEQSENLEREQQRLQKEQNVLETAADNFPYAREELTDDNGDLSRKVDKLEKEKGSLEGEIQRKSKEIFELQEKFLNGTDAVDILHDLQEQVNDLEKEKNELSEKCLNLQGDINAINGEKRSLSDENDDLRKENGKMRKENESLEEEVEEKTDEISRLQENIVRGSGTEEVLDDLQQKILNLEEDNKDLKKKSMYLDSEHKYDKVSLENGLQDENKRLKRENSEKEKEITDLQKKLLQGCDEADLLQGMQNQISSLKKEREDTANECVNLRDEKEQLSNKVDAISENLDGLEEEIKDLRSDNESKDGEIKRLQKAVIEGSGSEELLNELQEKLQQEKARNKCLEKGTLVKGNEKNLTDLKKENIHLQELNDEKSKDIEKLQHDLVQGSGAEDVLQDLQQKVRALEKENRELQEKSNSVVTLDEDTSTESREKQVEESRKENENISDENNRKQNEIFELQREKVDGSGQHDILSSPQSQIKEGKEQNENAEMNCDELKNEKAKTADKSNQIQKENKKFVSENQRCQDEINELQRMMVDGSGAEEIVRRLQNERDNLKNEIKKLEDTIKTTEEDNKDKIIELENEKDRIEKAGNDEIQRLQKELVEGTGSERIVEELQEKLKELEDRDKEKNGFKKTHREGEEPELRRQPHKEDPQRKVEVLEERCQGQRAEIERLLTSLVDGDDNEDLPQDEIKRQEMRNGELETVKHEQTQDQEKVTDDEDKEKLLEIIAALQHENDRQKDTITKLQQMLASGSGSEDLVKELHEEIDNLDERNKALTEENNEAEKEIGHLQAMSNALQNKNKELAREIKRLQKRLASGGGSEGLAEQERRSLEFENTALSEAEKRHVVNHNASKGRIDERQKILNEETVSESISEELQGQFEKLEKVNEDLKKLQEERDGSDTNEELKKLENKAKMLEKECESQTNEINRLQRALVEGTGSEDVLQDLQDQLLDKTKELDELRSAVVGREDLENRIGCLQEENIQKQNKIDCLQQQLVQGEGILGELQQQVRSLEARNKDLQSTVDDEERNLSDGEGDQNNVVENERELANLEIELEKLKKMKKEDGKKIEELRRKLITGTGGEEELRELEDKLKTSQKQVKELEEQCFDLKETCDKLKDAREINDSFDKQEQISSRSDQMKTEKVPYDEKYSSEFTEEVSSDGLIVKDMENQYSESLSNDECLAMLPKVVEERDHWKDKYMVLRKKVGAPFVDMIPEVWAEQADLEEERNDVLLKLDQVKNELEKESSPVVKNMSASHKIRSELEAVDWQIVDMREQLDEIRELQEQSEILRKQESALRQCIDDLETSGVQLNDNNEKNMDEKVKEVCEEVASALAESDEVMERVDTDRRLLDEKIKITEEITKLEQAINELQQPSYETDIESESTVQTAKISKEKAGQGVTRSKPTNQVSDLNTRDATEIELQEISRKVDNIKSSLEASAEATKKEHATLVNLVKEKSRLQDEITAADEALGQLGKRDYENLVKERAKQEKVAKRLLELAQEQENAQTELNELSVEIEAKQNEVLRNLDGNPPKRASKTGSIADDDGHGDSATGVSSTDESLGESSTKKSRFAKLPKTESSVSLVEELGSLMQRRSNLGARLESLGKEITAQSYKVEKSLLGATTPGISSGDSSPRGVNLGASYTSIDDLSRSQMSLFDQSGLVDELSLATKIVKDERIKRKCSRKAPMTRLLKEKAVIDKKLKELEGRMIVQNAKIRNSLRENKDPDHAKKKFMEAVVERDKTQQELENILSKIEECEQQNNEFPSKEERREASKVAGGKSLSKNDKRRLISQRKSLDTQLNEVQGKIEEVTLEEERGLEDFPEMGEIESFGKAMERLQELMAREAILKHKTGGNVEKNNKLDKERDNSIERKTKSQDQKAAETDIDAQAPYSGLLNVLQEEKENKIQRLKDIEGQFNSGKIGDDGPKTRNSNKKLDLLQKEVQMSLKEVENKRQSSSIPSKTTLEAKELDLTMKLDELTNKKEELEKKLKDVENSLDNIDDSQEELLKRSDNFSELQNKQDMLENDLQEIEHKQQTRKAWGHGDSAETMETAVDDVAPEEIDDELVKSYGDILKKMEEEEMNMADLMKEFKTTQDTLSKEREITGELLDLIKSRIGDELLTTLTGQGLVSPMAETPDAKTAIDVTVEDVIADYKRMNEISCEENQRLTGMLESLRKKLDEDLFNCIVDNNTENIDVDKMTELSNILDNNRTLFEQIRTTEANDVERMLNDANAELEELKNEKEQLLKDSERMEEIEKEKEALGETVEHLQPKVEELIGELEELKNEREQLLKDSERMEEIEKEKEALGETVEHLQQKVEELIGELEELKNEREQLLKDSERMEEIEKEKEALGETVEHLQQKVEELIGELEELKNEREQLLKDSERMEEIEKEKEALGETVEHLQQKVEELIGELEELKNEREQLLKDSERMEEIEKEKEALSETVEHLQQKVEELIGELEELKNGNGLEGSTEHGVIKDDIETMVKSENDPGGDEGRNKERIVESIAKEESELVFGALRPSEVYSDEGVMKDVQEELSRERFHEVCEENAALKETLDILEKENNELTPTLDQLRKTEKDLEDEVEYLRKEKEDLIATIKECEKQSGVDQRELERLRTENNEIKSANEQRVDSLSEELGGVREEKKKISEELESLEKRNKEVIQANDGLKKNIEEITEKRDDVIEEMKSLEKQKEDLLSKKDTLEQSMELLKKDLNDVHEERTRVDDDLNALKKVNQDLQLALEQSKSEEEHVKTELDQSNANVGDITGELNALREEKKRLFEEKQGLEKNMESLTEEIERLTKEKGEIVGKLDSLQKENSDLLAGKEKFEESIGCLTKEIGQVTEEKETVMDKLESFEKENNGLHSEKENLEESLEASRKMIEDLTEEHSNTVEELDHLQNKTDELQSEIEKLKGKEVELLGENKLLLKEKNDLLLENRGLEKNVESLMNDFDKLKADEEMTAVQMNDLRVQNDELILAKQELEKRPLLEELQQVRDEKADIVGYIEKELHGKVTTGVKEALEDYNKPLEDLEKENTLLREQFENLKNVIGKPMSEKLLHLPIKDQQMLHGTYAIPQCVQEIENGNVTVAKLLEQFETEQGLVKNRLGADFFSTLSNEQLADGKTLLKCFDDIQKGEKNLGDICQDYEDIIDEQERKIKVLEDEKMKYEVVETKDANSKDDTDVKTDGVQGVIESSEQEDADFAADYEDLIKQVMEHRKEIEDADELLREQKQQHEHEKTALLEGFQQEKSGSERQLEAERQKMAATMENLVNEIVHLKEERKEIRKNSRAEKEKIKNELEKERDALYNNIEKIKNEIQEKADKTILENLENEKRLNEQREKGFEDVVARLKKERQGLMDKLQEAEKSLEESRSSKQDKTPPCLKENEDKMKKELEEKLTKEKEKFQVTLEELRKEVARLQDERNKTLGEISKQNGTTQDNVPESNLETFKKLESDFRKKLQAEKTTLEGRVKELRAEKEELNREKQEIRLNMRKQRLEMSKKYEKEKQELAEKYRNEMKSLRSKLHEKTETKPNTNDIARSFSSIQQLQRNLREKDAKLRQYEVFFRELNQEATSVIQKD